MPMIIIVLPMSINVGGDVVVVALPSCSTPKRLVRMPRASMRPHLAQAVVPHVRRCGRAAKIGSMRGILGEHFQLLHLSELFIKTLHLYMVK